MRKIVASLIVVLIVVTGCSGNVALDYKEAVANTENAKSGQVNIEMKMDFTFNQEGLTEEELVGYSYFDEIVVNFNETFDNRIGENSIADMYVNFGGMGLDAAIYQQGEEVFMRLPILDSYIKVDEFTDNVEGKAEQELADHFEESFKEMSKKWTELVQEENIIKGEKTYIDTAQGQTKATVYNIKLNETQLKELKDVLDDTLFEEGMFDYIIKEHNISDVDQQRFIKNIKDVFHKFNLLSYEETAYVDFDGRLIKNTVDLSMEVNEASKGEAETVDFKMTIQYDQLDKDVTLEFPEVTEDMWIEMDAVEDLVDTLPSFD